MASIFYGPALEILRADPTRNFRAGEVANRILSDYPEVRWCGTQGPVRAMLLAAARGNTPIVQVPDSKPPLFHYGDALSRTGDGVEMPEASAEETMEVAYLQHRTELKAQLLEKVMAVSDTDFEEIVNQLVSSLGYGNHVTTPRGGDRGVDGHVFGDVLGLNVIRVQAKQYASGYKVQRTEIDAFIGALEGHHGVFVTTSDFTRGAKDKAAHPGVQSRIALINGERLLDLMIDNNVGVQKKGKRFDIKEIDQEYFANFGL